MRLGKVGVIAEFELRSAIRRPAYLFMTFGLPLVFAAIGGIPAYLQQSQLSAQRDHVAVLAAVDESGLLHLEERSTTVGALGDRWPLTAPRPPDEAPVVAHGTVFLRPALDRDEAGRMLDTGQVEGVIRVPADYLDGGALIMISQRRSSPFDVTKASAQGHLKTLLLAGLLHQRVPPRYQARISDPLLGLRSYFVGSDGRLYSSTTPELDSVARFLVPVVLSMLLLMALMTTGGYLVQGIGSEKENRVIEVLLATVRPDEILAGKLIGLGGAGLLQFSVWAAGFVGTLAGMLRMMDPLPLAIPWDAVAVAPVLFVMGYLFYGSLMLSTGSLGQTAAESQKLTMLWGMLAVLPMLFLPLFLESSQGLVPLLMHWIPFTAPLAIVLRMAQDPENVHAWEVVGSICVLGVCTWLSLRLGARVFRVGVMLGGGWPGWRQILRQAEINH